MPRSSLRPARAPLLAAPLLLAGNVTARVAPAHAAHAASVVPALVVVAVPALNLRAAPPSPPPSCAAYRRGPSCACASTT
jgi:hypothetical protein